MSRLVPLFAILLLCTVQADADLLDFESLTSLEAVTTQFPGLTFSNTIVLTAGISLNELDFPPRSGVNVVADDGGPISILFSTPALAFSGYFTYVVPLSLEAFDSSDTSLALAQSLFSANDVSGGDLGSSPNEFLRVSSASGISRVVITGDVFGGSFTMDDAEYTSAVPEPSSLVLLLTMLTAFAVTAGKLAHNHLKI